MKILLREDDNTRIVQGFYLPALSRYTIRRQRKRWWGWKTVAWLYTKQCNTLKEYQSYFNWEERLNQMGRKQF